MNENTSLTDKINTQLAAFNRIVAKGLSKPKQKFISQMLFGIQVARDVKLSEISRSLEENINLIKTENRLSRNLNNKGITEHLSHILIAQGSPRIERDTVIALDLTSIEKAYASKMDFLTGVWSGMKEAVVNGY